VTAFDELERGDIVWATDPLSEKGRPMLVLGTPQFPTHGVQLITVLISTKTYHEESLTLRDDDYAGYEVASSRGRSRRSPVLRMSTNISPCSSTNALRTWRPS
jgi:mRNA-degrading endonuclease toxin of MazEF toxin-antitoxin module